MAELCVALGHVCGVGVVCGVVVVWWWWLRGHISGDDDVVMWC